MKLLMSFLVLCLVALGQSQLPEDFDTLPEMVQQQYSELQRTKTRLTWEWIKNRVLWNIKSPKNYIYTIVAHQIPAPPINSATILVCNNTSNYTDIIYTDVNTMPLVFSSARELSESLQYLGSSINIEYDSEYFFPKEFIVRISRIFYDYSPEGEIIGMSMTGPQESGYKILDFLALEDDTEECTVL